MGKINLRELTDRKRAEGQIEIETDSETFLVDPPELWTDEMLELAESGDNLALTKALLGGDDAYARFKAAGGSQAVMGFILSESAGFAVPKSSPSSSRSVRTVKQ
jgi:hypothetical protein